MFYKLGKDYCRLGKGNQIRKGDKQIRKNDLQIRKGIHRLR